MRIRTMSAAMAALTILAACSKQSGTEGNVRIALEQQSKLVDVSTKSSVGDFTTLPSASAFTVKISDAQDNITPVTDLSAPVTLTTGNYIASATYGSLSDEGFDKPCFKGEQSFSVNGSGSQTVTIKVKLAGCIVRFSFTEAFTSYFSDYSFTVTTGGGTAPSSWMRTHSGSAVHLPARAEPPRLSQRRSSRTLSRQPATRSSSTPPM